MRSNRKLQKSPGLILATVLSVLLLSSSAFAQGSIFGGVTNSDLSTPANGEITFVGFLDNTDEEIRIETSDGAGYDAGNWFDDFQNYLTEAPGNPYDYVFHNTVNGEGFRLESTIPNNSFQQEDVALGAVVWPSTPTGLSSVTLSATSVMIVWANQPGASYHVYRRLATSNGSFFRVDDPSGSLANFGVADTFFVDNTTDGVSSYNYLVIADDGAGNLSPHSAILTVDASAIDAPVVTSIDPATGTSNGGTLVNVYGSGFDPAGATVSFGGIEQPGTVLTPFHVTAQTPAGASGAAVDVSVINTAATSASNVLTGGFTYAANAVPAFAAIPDQTITEGLQLEFAVVATDDDGDFPVLTVLEPLPGTATFVDHGDGAGTFTWATTFTDAGVYTVRFYATDAVDPLAVDSIDIDITVSEAGNQAPIIAAIGDGDTTIVEGQTLDLAISASDPDGEIPTLSVTPELTNATFTDNLDGTGSYSFTPDLTQSGDYTLVFKALDAALEVDSTILLLTVTETNQLPVLAAIGTQNGTEGVLLSFAVSASDPDGTTPVLSTSTLPGTATFTDLLDGTGTFEWTPAFTDAGTYDVTFYATDADFPAEVDSELVQIVIAEAGNQAPVITSTIDPQVVNEGGNLNFVVTASDGDGTIPTLRAEGVPTNATFTDNADGTGTFDFNPDFTQAGPYQVNFIAEDGTLADSLLVDITVSDGGNIAPVITAIGDFTVDEGGSLVQTITATDPDGGAIFPAMSVSTTLNNYTFVDNGDGTGTLTYNPDFYDAGIDSVIFLATDFGTPQQTSTSISEITTNDVNQAPTIFDAGPFGVAFGDLLEFTIVATDSTDPVATNRVFLSMLSTPTGATFTDNGDNTATFSWTPDETQVGSYPVTVLAVDQGTPQLSTSLGISIDVVAENQYPIFEPVAAQVVTEGDVLTLTVTASDPDGTIPAIDTVYAPENVTFFDNGDGTATFIYAPGFVGGTRIVSAQFSAYDGIATTRTQPVLIQVNDAGNQAPVFDSVPAPTVLEGATLSQGISAYDPDGGTVGLTVLEASLPDNATFTDNGDGTGTFDFSPDFTQAGLYDVLIVAFDGAIDDPETLTDTVAMTVTVTEAGNQDPTLLAIGAQSVDEGETLTLTVNSTDPDGVPPALSTSALPANATFTDNANFTGTFVFNPDFTQAGTYDITFYADDGVVVDSEVVTVTVNDRNRLPFVFTPGSSYDLFEGDSLSFVVEGFDADGTVPFLAAFVSGSDPVAADSLIPNMSFVDNRDLTGVFTFTPDYSQGGSASNPLEYTVLFKASDEDYPSIYQVSNPVVFNVTNRNQPPELVFPTGSGPFTLVEGDSVSFTIGVSDGDATVPPTLTAENVPANATLNASSGFGTFTFRPDFTQAGSYAVTFIGIDELLAADTAVVQITVTEAGNQAPVFTSTVAATYNCPINVQFQLNISVTDPEGEAITLTTSALPTDASFVDNGNGTGTLFYTPDIAFLGNTYDITISATDASLAVTNAQTQLAVVELLRGDLDNNKRYTMNDLAFLIGYLYRNGPAPETLMSADVDGDGGPDIGDVTYLILFMYYDGPPPPQ